MRRPVWSVNSYKGTELPSINVGDHNESWIDENMSYVKSDKARYLGSNLTSIQRRSVQDAKQWLTGVSQPTKMPLPAFLCRLPSATSNFGSTMTSNYVMTRKVPQTDSTDTHHKFFCTGTTCTLGERSRHRARMRPLASQALLLCLLSNSENAISALTDPRM